MPESILTDCLTTSNLFIQEALDIITIIGPTASGKTAIATRLSHLLGWSPIFSGDSRQVYRGMDIGTGKDLSEYVVAGEKIPYYLIDVAEPGERYNLKRYLDDAHSSLRSLPKGGPVPILCGGSGLYIEALIKGYELRDEKQDEGSRQTLERLSLRELQKICQEEKGPGDSDLKDPLNPRRLIRAIEQKRQESAPLITYPPLDGPVFCTDVSRETRRERITRRLHDRLEHGMIEEVAGLIKKVGSADPFLSYGLEYRFVTEYLQGKLTRGEMEKQLETAIHRFAKRQMTWIRGMEKRGIEVTYITPRDTPEETAEVIKSLLP